MPTNRIGYMTESENGNTGTGKGKQIVYYSQTLDGFRRYVSDDPTPAKLTALLKSVDQGDIAALCELQLEMEAKDGRLQGMMEKRRQSLTALEWDIIPEDSEGTDEAAASEAADFVRYTLRNLVTWPTTLLHMANGIGCNIAVVEKVFAKAELVKTVDVPCHRLTGFPWKGNGVYIETDEELMGHLATPDKFVVYNPRYQSGYPLRKTITHALVWPWMIVHFSNIDWMAFSELFGTPWRWGTYGQSVPDGAAAKLLEFLENMGADSTGVFPEGCEIKTAALSGGGSGETYARQQEEAYKTMAILILGNTLTTNVGSDGGARAAAQVHENVERAILASDAQSEAGAIREGFIRQLVELEFPGREMPIPYFQRDIPKIRDIEAERFDRETVETAVRLNVPIDEETVYDKLGVKRPEPGEVAAFLKKPEPPPTGSPTASPTGARGKDNSDEPIDINAEDDQDS